MDRIFFDKIKAFIFDLDDTLYPQKEYTRQCLLATSDYISKISRVEIDAIEKHLNCILDEKGIEYKYIFNDLFENIGFDGTPHLKEILELFRACQPKLELYENALEVLNCLKNNYRLALLTDGYEKIQHYKVQELELNDFFEEILVTYTLGEENRKPSPLPYQKLLDIMQLNAEECIYVGNDPKRDFIACKKLGMKSIRINQGDYKNLFLDKEYEADFCIDDIINLAETIKEQSGAENG